MSEVSQPVVVAQTCEATCEQVWEALTSREQMVQWYFEDIPAFEPEVGFSTEFVVQSEDRVFTHLWKVTESNPGRTVAYDWSYREWEGNAKVTFDLEPTETGCCVTLTCEGVETFTADIPEFKRESCEGGWQYFLGQLKTFVEGQ